MAENFPQMIGKYRIMGLVAKGGMGAVYKAVHPTLKRMVILKKLTIKGNATIRERFKREAQILLDMQSPYIVHLFDYFVEGNSHYIVEEFVDGLSLAQLLLLRLRADLREKHPEIDDGKPDADDQKDGRNHPGLRLSGKQGDDGKSKENHGKHHGPDPAFFFHERIKKGEVTKGFRVHADGNPNFS